MSGLKAKRVLVLGASSGIGAAAARRFADRGASVAVHYNENADGASAVVKDISSRGGHAVAIQADLLDMEKARTVVIQAREMLGGLDILINNAGAMFGRRQIVAASDDDFHDVINLNVAAAFAASREACRQFIADQNGGCVVNTTSIAARTGGGDGAGLYGSAKAFVSTLTRVLAKEMAPHGVRVNAVAPGVIMTPFHERSSTPEQLEASRLSIPMRRLGTPEDCAGTFEFLADETMSGYITGQIIEVNGGQLMP